MSVSNTVKEDSVQKLIVLAGPSGSGKSTFARKLINNQIDRDEADCALPNNTRPQIIKPRDLESLLSGTRLVDKKDTYLLHIAINNFENSASKKKLIDFFIDQSKPEELVIVTFMPDKYTLAKMFFKRMD